MIVGAFSRALEPMKLQQSWITIIISRAIMDLYDHFDDGAQGNQSII